MSAVVGLAGRVLWLYEALEADSATSARNLMNRIRPPARRSIYDYFIAEQLRPFVGIEPTRAQLESLPPTPHDAAAAILYLRAQLPILVLGDNRDALPDAPAEARKLARLACAPSLRWIADWAAASHSATDDPAGSLQRALAATTALTDYGESYTAARLMSDFLPLVANSIARKAAEDTTQRLNLMGAHASAARARSAVARS